MKEITVHKIDAARRQTDQAIRLFFSDQDSISIHTLASAAHQILRDMVSEKNSVSIYDALLKKVKPERKNEFINDKLNLTKNFFKHAKKEKRVMIAFRPEINEFVLYDNIALYEKQAGEMTDLMKIFKLWFSLKREKNNKEFLPDLTASINSKPIFFIKARREIDNMFGDSSDSRG